VGFWAVGDDGHGSPEFQDPGIGLEKFDQGQGPSAPLGAEMDLASVFGLLGVADDDDLGRHGLSPSRPSKHEAENDTDPKTTLQ